MPSAMRNRRGHSNSHGNEHLAELRDEAMEIGNTVKSMASSVGGLAGDALTPIEEYVQEKPMKALLMAAGIGAVLSFMFCRRS